MDFFTLTPIVDASAGSGPLNFYIAATDDNAGIDKAVVYFDDGFSYSYTAGSSAPNTTSNRVGLYGVYDSWEDGVADESKGIFDTSSAGIYTVSSVVITGLAGNSETYTTEELAASGFSTSFELSNPLLPLAEGYSFILTQRIDGIDVSFFDPSTLNGSTEFTIDIDYGSGGLSYKDIQFQSSAVSMSELQTVGYSGKLTVNSVTDVSGGSDLPLFTLIFNGDGRGALDIDINQIIVDDRQLNLNNPALFDYQINSIPQGEVAISGTLTQGASLTVTDTLIDDDGLGDIAYQWYVDGVSVQEETGTTLTRGQELVYKSISVTANYVDLEGTVESVVSTSSTPVIGPTILDDDGSYWNSSIETANGENISTEQSQLYRAYYGSFGRLPDEAGFSWWLEAIETGQHTLQSMATGFISSGEFKGLADSDVDDSISNAELVTHMYLGVFGRAPDNDGFYWRLNELDSGVKTQADAFISMTQSNEYVELTLLAVADFDFL